MSIHVFPTVPSPTTTHLIGRPEDILLGQIASLHKKLAPLICRTISCPKTSNRLYRYYTIQNLLNCTINERALQLFNQQFHRNLSSSRLNLQFIGYTSHHISVDFHILHNFSNMHLKINNTKHGVIKLQNQNK